jgi:hypothetical protein
MKAVPCARSSAKRRCDAAARTVAARVSRGTASGGLLGALPTTALPQPAAEAAAGSACAAGARSGDADALRERRRWPRPPPAAMLARWEGRPLGGDSSRWRAWLR